MLFNHNKTKYKHHVTNGDSEMKRNAKALIAGMVALAISQAAMAEDIKVAVVGAMSGPVAQWGDMEFNGARQAIQDINAKGGIKGDKLVAVEYDDACDPKQAVAVAHHFNFQSLHLSHLPSPSSRLLPLLHHKHVLLVAAW
jgi:branched-chain amino acid transport system substrate-binding protein